MKLRLKTWFLAVSLLLLAGGLGAWYWLLHSESGARWLFQKAASAVPAAIEATRISGDLASGLRLEGFRFDDGRMRIEARTVRTALNIDLVPPSVLIESFAADTVEVHLPPESDSSAGEPFDLESALGGLTLPIPVYFAEIGISPLDVYDAGGKRVLAVTSIETAGSLHRSLELKAASVSLPDLVLGFSGLIGLEAPWPVRARFEATGAYPFQGELEGSLEALTIRLEAQNPALEAGGTLSRLMTRPAWDLSIASPRLHWPLDGTDPAVELAGVEIRSRGDWPQFGLELSGDLGVEGLKPSRLYVTGKGEDAVFTVQRLALDGPELALEATGSMDWEDDLSLDIDADLQRLDADNWIEGWPDGYPVRGGLELHWGGEGLEVTGLSLGVDQTPMTVTGRGVVDLDSGVVDADLEWADLSWPPGAEQPGFVSELGDVRIKGSLDDWELDGRVSLAVEQFPGGSLQLSGGGDRESMELDIIDGKVLGGTLSGSIGWQWTGSQPFKAELIGENIHTEPLVPDAPAVLDTHLAADGTLEPFSVSVLIQRLEGTLMDLPVSLGGGLHIDSGRVRAEDLALSSGESSLSLNGALHESAGLGFSARVTSLAQFHSAFAGSFAADGKLSLDPESPSLSLNLSGQKVVLGTVTIENIETHALQTTPGGIDQEIVLSGLALDGRAVDSVVLRLGGRNPLEFISVEAVAGDTNSRLQLDGAVNDWSDPLASGWSGTLSELELNHADAVSLSLEQATPLNWQPARSALETACVAGTDDTRFCLAYVSDGPQDFDFSAQITALPLTLLAHFADNDAQFSQVLSGSLDWSGKPGRRGDGGARVELTPGTLKFEEDDDELLRTGPGLFEFELVDGQLQQGNLDIGFPGAGSIDIDFAVPDLAAGTDSPLRGHANLEFSDTGVLGVAFPLFDTIDGAFHVDLDLAGTLADPALDGTARLTNGHIENLASGFSFTEIDLAGEFNTSGRAGLDGSFRAGEGSGTIRIRAELDELLSPKIRLNLDGENLTLVDVPDLTLVANPHIEMGWHDRTLDIAGRVEIPAARLSPSYLPKNSVGESGDVVIVAGELPGKAESPDPASELQLRGEIEVALGDSVVIDLDVAKIQVTGATAFAWRDDPIPIASGGFDLTGEIQAYGQFLRLTRGRIGFPDIPADNPHLNIRAEREIFGNAQIRRAGLMIAGTLRRPVLEAYTVPMTNKDRARTLLVTGSDFNYEQGVGAVDVGMYVLPRLYVSYGVGVFEDGNVLKARFDIGRGFGVRATSGQRETGLDISYTLER